MNEWRVSLLARFPARSDEGAEGPVKWATSRLTSLTRLGTGGSLSLTAAPPHIPPLSVGCRPPGRAPPDPTVRRRYERWERDTSVARGDRRRKGSLTLRSLFAHSGLMSFAPQGGVSEASASRSSHPFRRSSGRNGTSERKREREVSERPASSITSSGHRLSPPSCDHCWWLKGLEVIRKIWEVNLGFHGRFLPVYHLFPSSTRFLSSYLRSSSSGCRSSTSLSIHLLRRNEGTEVSEWRTEEGKNGVRNGLSSLIHFAVLSPLLCHSARYTHLVPRSGLSGMRRSDEDRGEKSRVPAVRRFGSPHVISARFLRMSFTPFTRRSRSGGRKWTGVNGMLTSGENREPKRAAYSRH